MSDPTQGIQPEHIIAAAGLCLVGAFLVSWHFLLSQSVQVALTLVTVGSVALVAGIINLLHRDGLLTYLPQRLKKYVEKQSLLQFMRSSMFQNVPLGDLIALFTLPLQPHEFAPLLARLPESYRRALLQPGLHNLAPEPLRRLLVPKVETTTTTAAAAAASIATFASQNQQPHASDNVLALPAPAAVPLDRVDLTEEASGLASQPQSHALSDPSSSHSEADGGSADVSIAPDSSLASASVSLSSSGSFSTSAESSTNLSHLPPSFFAPMCQPSPHRSFSDALAEYVRARTQRQLHSFLDALWRPPLDLGASGRLEILTAVALAAFVLQLRLSPTMRRWVSTALTALAAGGHITMFSLLMMLWWNRIRRANQPRLGFDDHSASSSESSSLRHTFFGGDEVASSESDEQRQSALIPNEHESNMVALDSISSHSASNAWPRSSTSHSQSFSSFSSSSSSTSHNSSHNVAPLKRVLSVASDVASHTTMITKLVMQCHRLTRNVMSLSAVAASSAPAALALAHTHRRTAQTLRRGWLTALRASGSAMAFGASVPVTALAVWVWLRKRAAAVAAAAAAATVAASTSPHQPNANTIAASMLSSFGLTNANLS